MRFTITQLGWQRDGYKHDWEHVFQVSKIQFKVSIKASPVSIQPKHIVTVIQSTSSILEIRLGCDSYRQISCRGGG